MKHCTLILMLFVCSSVYAGELPAVLADLGLREEKTAQRDQPGWQRPERVVAWTFSKPLQEALQAAAGDVEVIGAASPQAALQHASSAQVLLGFCNDELLQAGTDIRWVQTYFAGVEKCVVAPGIQRPDMVLSNGQRLSSTAIGDHAISLMLALVRRLDIYASQQASAQWKPDISFGGGRTDEVTGATVLVVGLGGIGTEVARRAHGMGMRVVATRGSRREGPDFVEYVGLAHEAQTLAAKADVVINAVPLTDATRGMFDREFFKAMKPTAYYVSVGRGQTTVSDDLVAALTAGEIAGAGLDVTDPEPLPADHPLWTTPRVLITPHVAASSGLTMQRIQALVAENLRRYIAGDPLLSVVDIERGY